jgi:hypothetical protein
MLNFYKPLLLFFLLPVFSWAQSNYESGYVVTLKGDTLHGFIKFNGWENNPAVIFFKPNPTSNATKFTPKDIKYINIKVDFLVEYQKYEGPISTDNTDINNLNRERDSSFRMDDVFLKVLQKGDKVTLLSYSDDFKTRFFIQDRPDQIPKELVYRLYYNPDHDVTGTTVNENTYMKQLFAQAEKNNLMTDALLWDIQHSNYNELDILKIVSKINGVSATDSSKNNLSKSKPYKLLLSLTGFVVIAILVLSVRH